MKSIIEEASSLAKAFSQAWERAGKPQECSIKILTEPEKNFIGMTTKSAKLAIFFNETAPAQSKKSSTQSSGRSSSSQQKHTPVQTQQQSRTQAERQQPSRTERPRQEAPQRSSEARPTEQRSTETRPVEQRSNEPRPRQQRSTEQRPTEQRSSEQRAIEQRPTEKSPTASPRENSPRENLPREVTLRDNSPRDNSVHETSSHEVTQHEVTTKPESSVVATPRIRPVWTEDMAQAVRAWVQESLEIMSRTDVTFTTSMSRSMLTITFTAPLIEDLEKERLLFRSWSHLIVQHIKQEFKVHGKEFKIILKGSRN